MSVVTSNSPVGKKLLDSLQSDLRTISNEAKKKFPLLKEASEAGIVKLRCACGKQEDLRMALFTESSELMEPFFMACDTKSPKLVQVSLIAIQRMITFEAVNSTAASNLINALWQLMEVSIEEIKILQTLTLLVSTNSIVSSDSLSKSLSICFRLHFTKNVTVNNAASATIRQIVSVIFDRAVKDIVLSQTSSHPSNLLCSQANLEELKLSSKNPPKSLVESVALADAFLLFQDLIQLVNADEPYWLNGLTEMTRTFGLELLELIFKHYHRIFQIRPEFTFLLKERVAPVIIKLFSANIKYNKSSPSTVATNPPPGSLTSGGQPVQALNPSDKPFYPISIRLLRIVTILTNKYHGLLVTEVEIFMNLLMKFLDEDKPAWQRSVALESLHQLTVDSTLIKFFCVNYDMKSDNIKILQEMTSSLALFVQSQFLPMSPNSGQGLLSSLIPVGQGGSTTNVGQNLPGLTAPAQAGPGFSFRGYNVPLLYTLKSGQTKPHYLEQLDKNEVPAVPDGYSLTIAFHCILELVRSLVHLIEGSTVILESSVSTAGCNSVTSSAPGGAVRTSNPQVQSKTPLKTQARVEMTSGMSPEIRSANEALLLSTWQGLLAALSVLLESSTDETVTEVTLRNMEVLISLYGIYELHQARDAFVIAIGRASLPTGYNLPSLVFNISPAHANESGLLSPGHVSSLDVLAKNAIILQKSSPCPSLTGSGQEATSELRQQVVAVGTALPPPSTPGSQCSSSGPVMLTAKNLQVMRAVLMIAHNHGCVLNESWIHLLTTLQHLVWILGLKPSQGGSLKATRSGSEPAIGSPLTSSGMVSGSMTQSTLITTAAMSDLPVLTAMLSRLFSSSQELDDKGFMHLIESLLKLSQESMDLAYNNREPSLFAVAKLLETGLVNLFRIDLIWDPLMGHLLDISSHPHSKMRDWGSEAVTSLVVAAVSRNEGPTSSHQKTTVDSSQEVTIKSLSQSKVKYLSPLQTMSVINHQDIRQKQLDTCLHLLQSTGDSVGDGWPVILTIIGSLSDSQSENLIRLAFQCLQLVISEFLSSISIEVMTQVVEVTSKFALQTNELNVSLTAIGSIWNIADYLFQNQDRIKVIIKLYNDGTGENLTFEHLFLVVFDKLGHLCTDPRPAIRKSASQTLFAALNSHGSTLHPESWTDIIWTVLFPLLDRVHANVTSASDDTITDVPKSMGITGIGVTGSILLHHSRNTAHKQWSETQVLSLGGVSKIVRVEIETLVKHIKNLDHVWQCLLDHIKKAAISANPEVSLSALNSFLEIVSIQPDSDSLLGGTQHSIVKSQHDHESNAEPPRSLLHQSIWDCAWKTWYEIGTVVTSPPPSSVVTITSDHFSSLPSQSYLNNFVNIFPFIYNHIKESFTVDDFDNLCTVMEHTLAVPVDLNSQAYLMSTVTITSNGHQSLVQCERGSAFQMSPLQESVYKIFDSLSVDVSTGNQFGHLVIPFFHQVNNLTSYSVEAPHYGSVNSYPLIPKVSSIEEWTVINFVPFGEKAIKLLGSLYQQLSTHPIVIQGNILQSIIRSLRRPLTLKYSCPSQTTWKLAILTLLNVLKSALTLARQHESDFVTIWADLALTLEDFLFPTSRPPLVQSLEEQQSDEALDVKVVELIRDDILPFAAQIPQEFILQIVSVLNRGSIHSATADSPIDTESSRKLREDFARTCFETLLQFSFLGPRGTPNLFIQSSATPASFPPSTAETAPFDPNAVTNNKLGDRSALTSNTTFIPPTCGLDSNGLPFQAPVLEVGLVNRLAVTSLLQRFNDVVVRYVQDERLSGKCPLARHRVAEISFVLKALATLIQSLKKAPPESVEDGVWDQLINLYPQLVDCTTSSFVQVNRCLQEVLREYKDLLRPPKVHEYYDVKSVRSNGSQPVVNSLINGD